MYFRAQCSPACSLSNLGCLLKLSTDDRFLQHFLHKDADKAWWRRGAARQLQFVVFLQISFFVYLSLANRLGHTGIESVIDRRCR
ncbi:hypothetical protein BT96DRAFT_202590 [Gymnopus androsaceus JB14]|uniref:Uncharacterized protein n=1 Tax=Gymnopus androsaceus JB14 TaxID=1447944 RepID=A0A6A4H782_9AGAR|nr:hypothetical protein BT96DRAFT_202590 [Gymnopus androsaceus JB14]